MLFWEPRAAIVRKNAVWDDSDLLSLQNTLHKGLPFEQVDRNVGAAKGKVELDRLYGAVSRIPCK